jgi:hypothetical protein
MTSAGQIRQAERAPQGGVTQLGGIVPECSSAEPQQCSSCKRFKPLDEFGWSRGLPRRTCKRCRAVNERTRKATDPPALRTCSACGRALPRSAKLDVCRSNPDCLRINTSLHNSRGRRKQKAYTPCAHCGGDWLRAGGGEKLCGDCRQSFFWCSHSKHVMPLTARAGAGICRACRLLSRASERARERAIPLALTWEYVESLWSDTCPYLGVSIAHHSGHGRGPGRFSPTLDRIDPTGGYVVGNVEVISHMANTMKLDASPEQLVTFAREVLQRYAPSQETNAPPVARND